jgi:hypothetical protein
MMGPYSGPCPVGMVDVDVLKQYIVGRSIESGSWNNSKNFMDILLKGLIMGLISRQIGQKILCSVYIMDHNISGTFNRTHEA